MKIYGLSDARTRRIILFPRSPFLEYQGGSSTNDGLAHRFPIFSSIPVSFLKMNSPFRVMG